LYAHINNKRKKKRWKCGERGFLFVCFLIIGKHFVTLPYSTHPLELEGRWGLQQDPWGT
jgi:hypothetical protein